MVWPFIKKLRTFIKQRRKAKRQQQQQPQQQQGTPVMLTEFEAAQLAAERALSGTVQQQQQQQQAVPSMLSEFQAAQQAAEKALGHSNEDTAGEAHHNSPPCLNPAAILSPPSLCSGCFVHPAVLSTEGGLLVSF